MLTPQFVPVDGEAYDLCDILPVGTDTYEIFIQTLTNQGYTKDTYYWSDWPSEGDHFAWTKDFETEIPRGTVMNLPGQAYWVGGTSTAQSLQTSGKVFKEQGVSVQLQSGGTLAGNPYAVNIDINEITPTGENTYEVYIQTLTHQGYTDKTYYWSDWPSDGDHFAWTADFETEIPNETIAFKPGQALWIGGTSSEQYILFAKPESMKNL